MTQSILRYGLYQHSEKTLNGRVLCVEQQLKYDYFGPKRKRDSKREGVHNIDGKYANHWVVYLVPTFVHAYHTDQFPSHPNHGLLTYGVRFQ